MSSIHAFYAARLTRTFLGASNPARLSHDTGVTDTVSGDDFSGADYWRWPQVRRAKGSKLTCAWSWAKGGPLHIVNATVNETVDVRTKIQNQDRKGAALAIGPCGLSLGIQHHLVQPAAGDAMAHPAAAPHGEPVFRVFKAAHEGATTPEPLSLGRWMSVSGAAITPAAGAHTNVPTAILAGMFNVRLGYWWNSGMPASYRSPWSLFESVLPVQAQLAAELLARTRGTAGRYWNLSDGGHFENMGGYELIRRRLALIVIVDAEADPDYTFQGLSDLVRKARLDFNAEITFLSERELSGTLTLTGDRRVPVLPPSVRPYFGSLDALRRGRWTDERLPASAGGASVRYTIDVNRAHVSRAHAALARVDYLDNHARSWLLYIKATLMGDEPEDVCHYHRAHADFPQETTIDQFFDEAQWESYRRLGLHTGHRVLTPELLDHLRGIASPRFAVDVAASSHYKEQ